MLVNHKSLCKKVTALSWRCQGEKKMKTSSDFLELGGNAKIALNQCTRSIYCLFNIWNEAVWKVSQKRVMLSTEHKSTSSKCRGLWCLGSRWDLSRRNLLRKKWDMSTMSTERQAPVFRVIPCYRLCVRPHSEEGRETGATCFLDLRHPISSEKIGIKYREGRNWNSKELSRSI